MSLVQEINVEAMRTSIRQFVPENVLPAIEHLYTLLDQSMKQGYELGKLDGEENTEKAVDEAFDEGFNHGYDVGAIDGRVEGHGEGQDSGWDDGYLDGVDHARRRPDLADELVGEIISDQAQHALNGEYDFDPSEYTVEFFYEGDSGDEA